MANWECHEVRFGLTRFFDPSLDQRGVPADIADRRIDLGHGHPQEPHQYSPSLGNSEIRDCEQHAQNRRPAGRSAMRI